jgi:hypothetical protein
LRSAQSQANNALQNATNTTTQLGGEAQGVGATVTPFLTSELEHPQGYSQQDQSAMLSSALGGAGGANAGIVGQANQEAATSRNAGGFQAALDDAARQRSKAAAGASEGIAASNANLKQQQQQDAAQGLQKMYGTDTSGMLDAMGQQTNDINTELNAGKSGWLQNSLDIINTLNQSGASAAKMKEAFG